jgi:sulfate transport system ATP-binding protein
VRPHDIEILLSPAGADSEAMVERIVHLGFEVRVELVDTDGAALSVQLTRDAATELELERGDVVWVRTRSSRVFA